jgi:hypothetical protein
VPGVKTELAGTLNQRIWVFESNILSIKEALMVEVQNA